MAITVAQMQVHLEAARAAIDAGDYAVAEVQALAAQAVLAGLPDTENNRTVTTFRETIDDLLKNIRSIRSSGVSSSGRGATVHRSFEYFRD